MYPLEDLQLGLTFVSIVKRFSLVKVLGIHNFPQIEIKLRSYLSTLTIVISFNHNMQQRHIYVPRDLWILRHNTLETSFELFLLSQTNVYCNASPINDK